MALILDTGPLYASLDRSDDDYAACRRLIESAQEPLIIPAPVLVEVDFWIHTRLHPGVLVALLDDIQAGRTRSRICYQSITGGSAPSVIATTMLTLVSWMRQYAQSSSGWTNRSWQRLISDISGRFALAMWTHLCCCRSRNTRRPC